MGGVPAGLDKATKSVSYPGSSCLGKEGPPCLLALNDTASGYTNYFFLMKILFCFVILKHVFIMQKCPLLTAWMAKSVRNIQ